MQSDEEGGQSMLTVCNLQVMYGRAIQGVRDVSLDVRPNQIVALLKSFGENLNRGIPKGIG